MTTTTFTDKSTVIKADWANDVDALVYDICDGASTLAELWTAIGTTVNIDGGVIDGTTIGGTTPAVGSFTQVVIDNLDLNGNTLSSTSGNITIIPVAGSNITLDTNVTIDGGAVDITGDLDVDNLNLNGNTLISTDTNGHINITPDGTGLVKVPTIQASTGVLFGSDTAAANTLDDYEEGTFTPTIQDTSLSDAESQTYTSQLGYYTKIGNTVFFRIYIVISSLGTLTAGDQAFIAGLPFTSNSTTNLTGAISVSYANGLSITAGYSVAGSIVNNVARVNLHLWDGTSGASGLLISELTASGELHLNGQYQV